MPRQQRPIVHDQPAGDQQVRTWRHLIVDAPDAKYRAVNLAVDPENVVTISDNRGLGTLGIYHLDSAPDVHEDGIYLGQFVGIAGGAAIVARPDPQCSCQNPPSRKDPK